MKQYAFDLLKEKVFQLVDFHYDGEIEQIDCNCVFASVRNGWRPVCSADGTGVVFICTKCFSG